MRSYSTDVTIQILDATGHWRDITTVSHVNSQFVTRQMQFVKRQYPNSRVRAVDADTGSLVDTLP